jgi:glyoxylase-like metal-dependent hydrolase (beta-lactamase superfamily II)
VRIERVLAPNPGPFTGPGTNTWIVDDVGSVVVIDPGPLDRSHERSITTAIGDRHIAAVVVTHTHIDHAPLANPLARDLGVAALGYGVGPQFVPDRKLDDGSQVEFGSTRLEVVYTPGHSDDHLCFLVDEVLFTGDHIMGGSSVMVEDMSAYLRSLARVRQLDVNRLYPGHGDVMNDPHRVVDWYVAHRLQREQEILTALAGGAGTVGDIVEVVYRDVDSSLHPLAARSVTAHLQKLAEEGRVSFDGTRAELSPP